MINFNRFTHYCSRLFVAIFLGILLAGCSAKISDYQSTSPEFDMKTFFDGKLEAYGIAPPQTAGGPSKCPRCQSEAVEKISQFGSTPCKAQWRCTDCLEPFDYFKCI